MRAKDTMTETIAIYLLGFCGPVFARLADGVGILHLGYVGIVQS